MNRGARRWRIFRGDTDRASFLDLLGQTIERHHLELHCYALMSNHYHLTVRSRHATLSQAMHDLEATYAQRFHVRYGTDGPLFRGRFKNQIVNDEAYLRYLVAYIHLNPVGTGGTQTARDALWTSHRAYLGLAECPSWLTTSFIVDLFGGAAELDRFVADVGRGTLQGPAGLDREGWRHSQPGSGASRNQVTSAESVPLHEMPYSVSATKPTVAPVLLEISRIASVAEPSLRIPERGRGANPARRFAAWALCQTGQFTPEQIAECLCMSLRQYHCLLSRIRRGPMPAALKPWADQWLKRMPGSRK